MKDSITRMLWYFLGYAVILYFVAQKLFFSDTWAMNGHIDESECHVWA